MRAKLAKHSIISLLLVDGWQGRTTSLCITVLRHYFFAVFGMCLTAKISCGALK